MVSVPTRVVLGEIVQRALEPDVGRRCIDDSIKRAGLLRAMADQISRFKNELIATIIPGEGKRSVLDEIADERHLGFGEVVLWARAINIFLQECISLIPADKEYLTKILDIALDSEGQEGKMRADLRALVNERRGAEEAIVYRMDVYPIVIEVVPTAEAVTEHALDLLRTQVEAKPQSVIGAFTGGTGIPFWQGAAARQKAGRLDLSQVKAFFNLDEYVGVPEEWFAQTYAYYMQVNFYAQLGFNVRAGKRQVPAWNSDDPVFACKVYEGAIDFYGGVDLWFMGIGHTSHFAFCEPGTPVSLFTHVVSLDMRSRIANSRYFMDGENRRILGLKEDEDPFPHLQKWNAEQEKYAKQIAHFWNVVMPRVPTHAMTVGPSTLLSKARELVMLATGEGKAEAVAKAVLNNPTIMIPATLLKLHRDFRILMDQAAASRLPAPLNQVGTHIIRPDFS